MEKHARRIGFILLGALLAGAPWAAGAENPSTAVTAAAPADFPLPADRARAARGESMFRIDGGRSEIRIYVYRAGPLAWMGHNHVLSSTDMRGYVALTQALRDARADLYVPVSTLIVDDPNQRRAAGKAFATTPDAAAIAGVRRNMLRARSLDADAFPFVRLNVRIADASLPHVTLAVSLRIRGITRELTVPAEAAISTNEVIVSGNLQIRQSDYGMTPYRVFGGALAVRDSVDVEFRLVAERAAATQPLSH